MSAITAGVKFTMCVDISSHTQHTPCDRFIVWQILSISSIGHLHAILHEHKCKHKLMLLFTAQNTRITNSTRIQLPTSKGVVFRTRA